VLVTCESPENEELVMDVVKMIEREAHTHGLTDRVLDMIKKGRKGGKVVEGEGP
jgi:exosome complex RNA-binding protein Rrp4